MGGWLDAPVTRDDQDILSSSAAFFQRKVGGEQVRRTAHAIGGFANVDLAVALPRTKARFGNDDLARYAMRVADVDALDEETRGFVRGGACRGDCQQEESDESSGHVPCEREAGATFLAGLSP